MNGNLAWTQNYKNVLELDLSLWKILQSDLANQSEIETVFSNISKCSNRKLIQCDLHKLQRLASGTICSFQLDCSERPFIEHLNSNMELCTLKKDEQYDFSSAYWLLVGRLAALDIEFTMVTFGISKELAEGMSCASDNYVRQLSSSIKSTFKLRFPQELISRILTCNKSEITNLILLKNQASIIQE